MNLAYIGNSVSAQKGSYKHVLNDLLMEHHFQEAKIIHCTLGGIGSLGISFFMDRFIGNTEIDLCFIETFVADAGGATPTYYIPSALKGILKHDSLKNALIIPLFLYRSDITFERCLSIIDIYMEVFTAFNLVSVNLFMHINELFEEGAIFREEIVYDKVHTTSKGASYYAKYIYEKIKPLLEKNQAEWFNEKKEKDSFEGGRKHVNSILPKKLEPFTRYIISGSYSKGLFRLSLPYIKINRGDSVEVHLGNFECVGLIVIADDESGVLDIERNEEVYSIQIFDAWCDRARIQVVIFPKPFSSFDRFYIKASNKTNANRTANLFGIPEIHAGSNIKIVHLMGFEWGA